MPKKIKTKATKKAAKRTPVIKGSSRFLNLFDRSFKAYYFIIVFLLGLIVGGLFVYLTRSVPPVLETSQPQEYWMVLHRKSNKEFLYRGVPGDTEKSSLVKSFTVKTGIPGQRPTPLPQALGKKYWKIVKKYSSSENPETAPYFLELDVPVEDGVFGPVPYNECNGQCSWILPGYFGLHGVNGDTTRLGNDNPGSSGCIRHTDQDITYLYNLLEVDEGVRYYIVDR